MKFVTKNESETIEVGRKIGEGLEKGDIVLISGVLGAGKTRLVKGIASALGVEEVVTSPTFTILNEYPSAKGILYHIDLYRLEAFPADDIDIDDLLERGIVVVEWWEKDKGFFEGLKNKVIVNIEILSDEEREITVYRE